MLIWCNVDKKITYLSNTLTFHVYSWYLILMLILAYTSFWFLGFFPQIEISIPQFISGKQSGQLKTFFKCCPNSPCTWYAQMFEEKQNTLDYSDKFSIWGRTYFICWFFLYTCRVTNHLGLPETEGVSGMRHFQCEDHDSPEQTGWVCHLIHYSFWKALQGT